ncbi:MAG: hypothetical protein IJX46_07170, partial [Clostridia bacterium]|nr:hypothetical protein [Clostridia bacterium]
GSARHDHSSSQLLLIELMIFYHIKAEVSRTFPKIIKKIFKKLLQNKVKCDIMPIVSESGRLSTLKLLL